MLIDLYEKIQRKMEAFNRWLEDGESLSLETKGVKGLANESVSMDLPSFKSLLPYETIDENLIFINHQTLGFGLELSPAAGADEALVLALSEFFKNKLPGFMDCTVLLYKHQYLQQRLSKSFMPIIEKGGIYQVLAEKSLQYHLKAIGDGYHNQRSIPAHLADYQVYLFFTASIGACTSAELVGYREEVASFFQVTGFSHAPVDAKTFQILLRTIVSPVKGQIAWPQTEPESDCLLRDPIPNPGSSYQIHDKYIDIETEDAVGETSTTRLVNMQINRLPDRLGLWETPDLFANLLTPDQGIACPFLVSFNVRGIGAEKTRQIAKSRADSLTGKAQSIQARMNPSIIDEAKDWSFVHQEASRDNLNLVYTFYNLILITTPEDEKKHVAQAISAYRQLKFEIGRSRYAQWLRFLASLPFMMAEGLNTGLMALGAIRKLTHFNAANLMPVVADFKGSSSGVLLPTYRHQLSFLDPFDDKNLPITNYNRLLVASSGSGKSHFQQYCIMDALSRGHLVFVIDLGESYKHLCHLVGGSYIDASSLKLNPFTLFDFESQAEVDGRPVDNAIQICNLLAIMSNPEEPIGEVEKAWLLNAVQAAWHQKGNKACIDDVLFELNTVLSAQIEKDSRLSDLILLLSKFGQSGLYGEIFNQETPLLNGSNLVVLEMGGLSDNKALLKIIMFAMIVIIQGQFYHSDRKLKKHCVIDEAWRFLTNGNNSLAAEFIETGFRTARKYNGSFTVITQYLKDTSETLQGQAIAASSDTKIIMRQGSFKDYMIKNPEAFNPLQEKMIESFAEASGQGFSSMMIQYGQVFTFHRYFSDPFSRVLFSSRGEEFTQIEELVSQGMSIASAVEQVALQNYGDC